MRYVRRNELAMRHARAHATVSVVLWGKSVACTRACRIEHVVTAMLATRHARSRRIVDEVIERFERLGGRPLPGSADQNYATQTLLKFAGQA